MVLQHLTPLALALTALTTTACQGPDPQLGWLEGRWEMGSGFELWERSAENLLTAEHVRYGTDGAPDRVTERLTVEIGPERTTLTPELLDASGRPTQAPVVFELTDLGRSHAVFTNPEHGSPHTIGYRRDGPDKTTAWILIRNADGSESRVEFGKF